MTMNRRCLCLGYRDKALLKECGYSAKAISKPANAINFIKNSNPMPVIIDAALLGKDCRRVLNALRARHWPIIFITDTDGNLQHLQNLYGDEQRCAALPRPVSRTALQNALRSIAEPSDEKLEVGELSLSLVNRLAYRNGVTVPLTEQEFELLRALMASPRKVKSRTELLQEAWGYIDLGSSRTVDMHVRRLRAKLGEDLIETIYRQGYRLAVG